MIARTYLAVVTVAAVATSYWTAAHWILANGGDLVHAIGTPAGLEVAALAAARHAHVGDRVARWVLGGTLGAAVAINFAYGLPSLSLALAYAIAPVVAVAIGVLFVREVQGPLPVDTEAASEPAEPLELDDDPEPEPVLVRSNGHRPSELARAAPDSEAMDRLIAEAGSIKAAAELLGVSRDKLNYHRRQIGHL